MQSHVWNIYYSAMMIDTWSRLALYIFPIWFCVQNGDGFYNRNILLLIKNRVMYRLDLMFLFTSIIITKERCIALKNVFNKALTPYRNYCNLWMSECRYIMLSFRRCQRCTLYNIMIKSLYRWRKHAGGTWSLKWSNF